MPTSATGQLFLVLCIIILVSKAAGYFTFRLGLTSMFGAMVAGVALGPSLFNLFEWPVFINDLRPAVAQIADLGFLLLIFGAGLEVGFSQLGAVRRAVVLSGWLGVGLTMLVCLPLLLVLGVDLYPALFVAITLSGTGNGIVAQMVLEMGLLRLRSGLVLLGAAMIDDILVLLMLSLLIIIATLENGLADLGVAAVRIVIYGVAATGLGWFLFPPIMALAARLKMYKGSLAMAVCLALLYGWAAEAVGGLAPIIGAFIAGICFGRVPHNIRENVEEGIQNLNYGLLVPVFFVNIGIRTDLHQLELTNLPLILSVTVAAIAAKLVGCGLGARLGGLKTREAVQVAVGMIPRGAVGLAVGSIGLNYGFLPGSLFPQLVLIILGTTIIAPPLLNRVYARDFAELAQEPSVTPMPTT
jgi:Kef-type K+ transport system membrane component KefB